ncbi:fimbria/pilus periplasmic chaperone [Erwinia aphidicola]|nr:fimbria/pilus periplasmic chaperone [Erwinia aphidicola]
MFSNKIIPFFLLSSALATQQASAAISLDRTRVIFDGKAKSASLSISNQNTQLPYLAQTWIEDEKGNKINSPLTALPAADALAQDRETLYYFNLREIPPKSDKANTLQIALQTRIKLLYRPAALYIAQNSAPPQEKLTLTRKGDRYLVNNPTGYYITLIDGGVSKQNDSLKDFKPLMVAPKSSGELNVTAAQLGTSPVLKYIDDYGGRPSLSFSCSGNQCQVVPGKGQDQTTD